METIYEKIKREKREPEDNDIFKYIKETGNIYSYYSAREKLRNLIHGETPPNGFSDWGTYFKSY